MRKLVLFSLAAGTMLAPGNALAMQDNIVDPPVAWEDVPTAELHAAESAGTSWQQRATPRPAAPAMRHAPAAVVHHAPAATVHHAPPAVLHHSAPAVAHATAGAGAMHGGGHFNRFKGYHRVNRGWRMPRFWHGPRFHVMNWRSYGFPAPRPGWVWIRYYDDALLIDRDGTVHDGRYGFDWDRYDDRWERDEYGVPYHPGDEDYDDYEDRDGPDVVYRHGPAHPGYGYGYGYAYGYPMVVTETVTTTTSYGKGGHGKHKVVHHQSDCDCGPMMAPPPPPHHYMGPPPPPPPPPPPLGEKG